jgi:hypothetical protein
MRMVVLTLKGILLYSTMIVAMLYVAGIDSIYDNGYFIEGTLVVVAMIYICYITINEKEFSILTLEHLFKLPEEDDEW